MLQATTSKPNSLPAPTAPEYAHTFRHCHAYYAALDRCGPKTRTAHHAAIRYCHQQATGGVLRAPAAEQLVQSPRPYRAINRLLELGLWIREGDGFTIADYAILPRPAKQLRIERAMRRIDSQAVIPVNIVDAARAYVRPPPAAGCPYMAIAMRRTGKTADELLAQLQPEHEAEVASIQQAVAMQQATLRAQDMLLTPGGDAKPVPWVVARAMGAAGCAALAGELTPKQRQDWQRVVPTLGELRAAVNHVAGRKGSRDWGLVLWRIQRQRQSPDMVPLGGAAQELVAAARQRASTDSLGDSYDTNTTTPHRTAGTAPVSAMAG